MFIKTMMSTVALGLACVMLVPAVVPFTGYDNYALAKQGGQNDAGSGTTDRSRDRNRCCGQDPGFPGQQTKINLCKTNAKTRVAAIAFCTRELGRAVRCTGEPSRWTCK